LFQQRRKAVGYNYSGTGNETIFICDAAPGWYYIGQAYIETPGTLYTLTAEVGDNFGIGYIEGKATDPQGLGLENIFVEVYPVPGNWNYSFPMITTASDGHFKVGLFPGTTPSCSIRI
jgi:hypothetical protein